jgi:putative glutamine amidotransferase
VAIPGYRLAGGRVSGWKEDGFGLPARYVDALRRAGARTAVLPSPDTPDVVDGFDALVLAGGGDLGGLSDHPEVYGVDPGRDELELALARHAAATGLPTLAVCRGLQVVNVAFGGTLIPHIPDVPGLGSHGPPGGGLPAVHDVEAAPGSRLAAVCGTVVHDCVSHHHQAVEAVGEGLVPVGWAEDGLVEALEPADSAGAGGFYLAVQWHPEMSAAGDPVQQSLFDALVAAART